MGITAIGNGGGPALGFCGGRVDEMDGSESNALGPTPFQEQLSGEQATCPDPIGTSQIELIYALITKYKRWDAHRALNVYSPSGIYLSAILPSLHL